MHKHLEDSPRPSGITASSASASSKTKLSFGKKLVALTAAGMLATGLAFSPIGPLHSWMSSQLDSAFAAASMYDTNDMVITVDFGIPGQEKQEGKTQTIHPNKAVDGGNAVAYIGIVFKQDPAPGESFTITYPYNMSLSGDTNDPEMVPDFIVGGTKVADVKFDPATRKATYTFNQDVVGKRGLKFLQAVSLFVDRDAVAYDTSKVPVVIRINERTYVENFNVTYDQYPTEQAGIISEGDKSGPNSSSVLYKVDKDGRFVYRAYINPLQRQYRSDQNAFFITINDHDAPEVINGPQDIIDSDSPYVIDSVKVMELKPGARLTDSFFYWDGNTPGNGDVSVVEQFDGATAHDAGNEAGKSFALRRVDKPYIVEVSGHTKELNKDIFANLLTTNTSGSQVFDITSAGMITSGSGAVGTETKMVKLGDLVWLDSNNNGLQDDGEPGVAGVLVRLIDQNNNTIAYDITDSEGKYEFDKVIPGTYTIEFSSHEGYLPAQTNAGDTEKDSNGQKFQVVVTKESQDDLSLDYGLVKEATGTYVETHEYYILPEGTDVDSYDFDRVGPDFMSVRNLEGKGTEQFTTRERLLEGFKLVKVMRTNIDGEGPSVENPRVVKNFKDDQQQMAEYVYVRTYQTGTYEEVHEYYSTPDGTLDTLTDDMSPDYSEKKSGTGDDAESFTNNKIDREGYTLVKVEADEKAPNKPSKDTPEAKNNYIPGQDLKFKYVYVKKAVDQCETHTVTANYVDEKDGEVLASKSWKVLKGQDFEVTTPQVENYTYKELKTGEGLEQNLMISKIDADKNITLVYKQNEAPKTYTITVKHQDKDGAEIPNTKDTVYKVHDGDDFTVVPEWVENYNYTEAKGELSFTGVKENKEVILVYTPKEECPTPVSKEITLKYVNAKDKSELGSEKITVNVGDKIVINGKHFDNYTISKQADGAGNVTVAEETPSEFVFEYTPVEPQECPAPETKTITINYKKLVEGGEPQVESKKITVTVGDKINIAPKHYDGYTVKNAQDGGDITVDANTPAEYTFEYSPVKPQECPEAPVKRTITVNYVTDKGTDTVTYKVVDGDELNLAPKHIDGYSSTDAPKSITVTKDENITFNYTKNEECPEVPAQPETKTITVKYVTNDGKTETAEYKVTVGDKIELAPKHIDGYKSSDAKQEITVSKDSPSEIIFNYTKVEERECPEVPEAPVKRTITVNYVTDKGTDTAVYKVVDGDELNLAPKHIDGYSSADAPKTITVTKDENITFNYTKNAEPECPEVPEAPKTYTITVVYDRGQDGKETVEYKVKEGDSISIEPRHYNSYETKDGAKKITVNGNQNFTFTYSKVKEKECPEVPAQPETKTITVKYVTNDGKTETAEYKVTVGDKIELAPKHIDGYKSSDAKQEITVSKDSPSEITFNYSKVEGQDCPAPKMHKITVSYVDESGKELSNSSYEVVEGSNFKVEAKDIEGYRFDKVVEGEQNLTNITEDKKVVLGYKVEVCEKPKDPSDPKPVDPGKPVDPSKPGDPDPSKPVQPGQPSVPAQPVQPSVPTQPAVVAKHYLPKTGESHSAQTGLIALAALSLATGLIARKRAAQTEGLNP